MTRKASAQKAKASSLDRVERGCRREPGERIGTSAKGQHDSAAARAARQWNAILRHFLAARTALRDRTAGRLLWNRPPCGSDLPSADSCRICPAGGRPVALEYGYTSEPALDLLRFFARSLEIAGP
jgi:hypothetical protein